MLLLIPFFSCAGLKMKKQIQFVCAHGKKDNWMRMAKKGKKARRSDKKKDAQEKSEIKTKTADIMP